MAAEGTLNIQFRAEKSYLSISKSANINFDVATARRSGGVQAIGTTYEAVAISADVATAGYAWFRNLDLTNFVEIGVVVASTFYPLAKLKPGEIAVLRLATTTIFAQSNTAPTDLEFEVVAN